MQDLSLELAQTLQIFPRIKHVAHRNSSLTQSEISFIGCLYRAEGKGQPYLTPSEIGKRLGISRPAVTAIINQAIKQDIITRTIDIVDKRRVQISLTQQGRGLFEKIWEELVVTVQKLLDRLGAEDGENMVRLLKKSLDILQEL